MEIPQTTFSTLASQSRRVVCVLSLSVCDVPAMLHPSIPTYGVCWVWVLNSVVVGSEADRVE